MVFRTYYSMATVINRHETRFTVLAFNRNNSREIMQRAQFERRFFMAVPVSQELPRFPDSLLPSELHGYNLPWEPDWGIDLEQNAFHC